MVDNDGSFRQSAIIKFLVKAEKSAAVIHLRLQRAYGGVCMGASSVRRWVKHCENGNTSIQDEPRSGRPRTVYMERNNERVDLKFRRALREKRSGKKIMLQHDNVWPHTDRVTLEKIRTFGWETFPQSPYSPDLEPSDYHLFEKISMSYIHIKQNEKLEIYLSFTDGTIIDVKTNEIQKQQLQVGGISACVILDWRLDSSINAAVSLPEYIDGLHPGTFRLKEQDHVELPTTAAYNGKLGTNIKQLEDISKVTHFIPDEYKSFYEDILKYPNSNTADSDKVLKGRWCDIIVINAHAPTEEKDDHIKNSFYEELEHTFDQFPRYHMKILLGDFNAKVGREDIFRPTIGKESIHAISSDNGVRLVNFATSKNLIVKSTTFPHKDIHKYTWTSPDGLTHNQIDHILIDKRRHTSIVDIRTFRGADCNSDHYLVIGELRERLSVAKRVEQQVNITKFNILKLKDEEAKQNYQVEISNRFATLESSDEVEKELDVNSVWKISEIVSKLQLSRA
ncbi:hypothetical protein ANN_06453 [Periplaneta americana]|uniref:Endonuclease/exonuclease/phosphatase domain-containing protein n=1 Tax=Periplaneta americana TaxID=6978 RepID=A0ABQ8TDK3_PERAM|nr:hypothetical protein ANN_06453 [Periplaneta americana]